MKPFAARAFLLGCLLCTGCVMRIADMTLCSTKSVDLRRTLYTETLSKAKGESRRPIVLLFPGGMINIEEAIDNAIESTPGAVALANVKIDYGYWFVPLICASMWYSVEGNPVYERQPRDAKPARSTAPRNDSIRYY